MTTNEEVVRRAYKFAEGESADPQAWNGLFTETGVFTNYATGQQLRGESLKDIVVEMVTAFPDVHREIHELYSVGDTVIVQLSIRGTHNGPMPTMVGTLEATGRRVDIPGCDIFTISDGKIERFDAYPSATVLMAQLGVLDSEPAS